MWVVVTHNSTQIMHAQLQIESVIVVSCRRWLFAQSSLLQISFPRHAVLFTFGQCYQCSAHHPWYRTMAGCSRRETADICSCFKRRTCSNASAWWSGKFHVTSWWDFVHLQARAIHVRVHSCAHTHSHFFHEGWGIAWARWKFSSVDALHRFCLTLLSICMHQSYLANE